MDMTREEEDGILAQAKEIQARRLREANPVRRHEPPFDGKPCPMCPTAIRNLSAVAHNFLWRWESGGQSPCKVNEKFGYLRDAVASVAPLLTQETHAAIRELHEAGAEFITWWDRAQDHSVHHEAVAFAREQLTKAGARLRAAKAAVEPLSGAHFADRVHSHGSIN